MVKIVLAVLILLLVPKCHAVTNGADAMHNCGLAVKLLDGDKSEATDDVGSIGKCMGMVEGVMNTLRQWEASSKQHHSTLDDTACFPAHVTIEQAIRVSYKYMQDHPEQLHAAGSGLVYLALTQAFPCKAQP